VRSAGLNPSVATQTLWLLENEQAARRLTRYAEPPMRAIDAGTLMLEPQTAMHAEEMFAVLSDPAIYEFENQPPSSAEWLRARFEKLESRRSADGTEQWLNWVIRISGSGLIGYVQATVRRDGNAAIAYEMSSAHWGRGLARRATEAMLGELAEHYRVTTFFAVAKLENFRSIRLLERLGFLNANSELCAMHQVEPGEILMVREDKRP
jgi:RimJ/RimL family protein N-acetyltransferase